MPKGQSKNDPVADVADVWLRGHLPEPTLAQALADSLPPVITNTQRTVTAEEAAQLFGSPPPELPAEPAAGLEPGAEDPTPVGRELVKLDGLEQFKTPVPEDSAVIPLEIASPAVDLGLGAAFDPNQPGLAPPVAVQTCTAGHETPAGAKFCMECGEDYNAVTAAAPVAPQDWTCVNLHLIDGSAKFCAECGDARPDLKPPVAGAGFAAEQAMRAVPDQELTPEARAERERLHAAALRAGREDPRLVIERPTGQRPSITFHIVKSGWTWAGQVWFRGQEIVLEEGTARWQEAQRFINWTEAEQMERYGCIRWRLGPWPYRRSYAEADPARDYQKLSSLDGKGQVTGPSIDQLKQADEQERRRAGGVPRPMYL